MNKIRKAVIPAAGFGTRFLPATKAIPKEMLPIVDTPTLQYVVEEAVKSGITEILIIIGKNKKCIEDHFDKAVELEQILEREHKDAYLKMVRDITDLAHIHYVRQKEMNGSGSAVLEAEAFISGEPFAVMYGDDIVYNPEKPCLKQLIDAGCTAVWVPGEDMRALEVNWLIQELAGKRIPEDISLLGSENPGISEFQRPSLTTIAIPLHEMAEIAVDLVMQGDVSCLRKIELPAKLIERNSVSVLKH